LFLSLSRLSSEAEALAQHWQQQASESIAARTSAASSACLALALTTKARCQEHVVEMGHQGREHAQLLTSAGAEAAAAGKVMVVVVLVVVKLEVIVAVVLEVVVTVSAG
jgi:hypothetical protein